MASLGDTVMRLYQADTAWGHPEFNDDGDSASSGSMSPDLGGMWSQDCPKSPNWDGDLELTPWKWKRRREEIV